MIKRSKYTISGHATIGFAILEDGAILYDLLETKQQARVIRDVLLDGIGPEWDAVKAELEKRGIAALEAQIGTGGFQ
jgi:hypothetical protein